MNVVFDFGGVLFDWRPHDLLKQCLPDHTATPRATQALEKLFFEGYGGDWSEFDRGAFDAALLAERISGRTGLSAHEVRRVIDSVPNEMQPLPASVDLLHRLQAAGHALFFLSNMPEPYARHLEAVHDFLRVFRSGIFSARVRLIKPEAALFAHAQAAFGIAGEPTLFIDDVSRNVTAARAAGWQAIHFRDAFQCERELRSLELISTLKR
jgi:putative hydrolase of the HAD superfamily